MEALFERRTRRHIALVRRNMRLMEGYEGLSAAELERRGRLHDRGKFEEPERSGYVWLTWRYRERAAGRPFRAPRGVDALIERTLRRHRAGNAHHPEAHAHPDAMTPLDLVELVCDWTAIAQETGGDCGAWAREHSGRWPFSPAARALLFSTIEELERRLRRPQLL